MYFLDVLVALLVSSWNQGWFDRGRADGFYRRINAELVADRLGIDVALKFWKTVSVIQPLASCWVPVEVCAFI